MAAARIQMTRDAVGKVMDLSDDALTRLAAAIAADARRLVPVDEGKLRAGIDSTPGENGVAYVYATRDVPGEDPLVPVYVELGTRHMAAQPYLRPALFQRRTVS